MRKTIKIRNQAFILMAVISIWALIFGVALTQNLNEQRKTAVFIKDLSIWSFQLDEYYQSGIENILDNNSLFGNLPPKIDQALVNLTTDLKFIKISSSQPEILLTQINNNIETIKNNGELIGEALVLSDLNLVFKKIDKDILLLFDSIRIYHSEVSNKINITLVIGFISFICLFLLSTVWLLLYKTLHPLSRIKTIFDESDIDYHAKELSVDSTDEIGALADSFNMLRKKTITIEKLNHKLIEHDHFEEILDYIFDQFKPFIPYNRIGIAVLSSDKKILRALSARSDKPVKLGKKYELPIAQTSLESIIQSGEPRILNDLENYYAMKSKSESTGLILEEGMKSSVTLPLIVRNECVGVVFFSSINRNVYSSVHVQFLNTIAESLAAAFDHSFLNDQLVVSTIQGFARLVESKDEDTGNHIERMQSYSVMIAELLRDHSKYASVVSDKFVKQISDFSPLHDIGKVAIPESILLKPGKLTASEYEIMKSHAIIGSDILSDMNQSIPGENRSFYKVGIEIVRNHHERYDGNGYPDKLTGKAIPLSARIVAIADVLDALVSKRSYKEAYTISHAKDILSEGRGAHFDPDIIDLVLENWDRFKEQAIKYNDQMRAEGSYLIS